MIVEFLVQGFDFFTTNITHTVLDITKVIYIRLAIMIHLDGNALSFALVSKQK